MPTYSDDSSNATGDIFTDERNRMKNPTSSSTMGTTYPHTSGPNFVGPIAPSAKPAWNPRGGEGYNAWRDRTRQTHTEPLGFSRDSLGRSQSTGATRRYAGTVNIGAGDNRRTLGFRTGRDYEKARRLVDERNRRVGAIRADATRRGISLKEAQDMNNQPRSKGLSFGEKILMNAGTRFESGEKDTVQTHPTGFGKHKGFPFTKKRREYRASKKVHAAARRGGLKRNAEDNKLPRSAQRKMRGMVPPGTFEKKSFGGSILSKAGTRLEPGEKAIPKEERARWTRYGGRAVAESLAGEVVGGATGAGIGAGLAKALGKRAGRTKAGAIVGGIAGMYGGGITGGVHGLRKGMRNEQARGRNVGKFAQANYFPASIGIRKNNPNEKYRPGAKSAETDSFGRMVMDQARASLPKE